MHEHIYIEIKACKKINKISLLTKKKHANQTKHNYQTKTKLSPQGP